MVTPNKILSGVLFICISILGQYRSPEITEHPADLLVPRNEPATLNCHAVGRPIPTITWYKDGHKFKLHSGRHVQLGTGGLFFLKVVDTKRYNDGGIYMCVASSNVGSAFSRNASLEIAVLGDEFEELPEGQSVSVGDTVTLHCIPPRGNPEPVVQWLKDDIILHTHTSHRYRVVDGGSLMIVGVRISDSGQYICRARNVFGQRQTPPVTLSVQVPPHLISTSGTVVGVEGSTVELVCRVGGDPPPQVLWQHVNPSGELPVGRIVQEEGNQVLRLHHLAREDQGIYTCQAENPVGSVAANITLTVHSRPMIKVTPRDARVAINGTASFQCLTTGSPPPTTYWTHEGSGHVVEAGQTWGGGRWAVDGNNTLIIHSAQPRDEGYYLCSAVGVSGAALARAHLEVQSPSDIPPPLVALAASNQTLPLGTEGDLPCEVWGTPKPKVVWYKSDNIIKTDQRIFITPLGTLRITDLRISDTDVYMCMATSASGKTTWTASLVVAKPTNPNVAFFKIPDQGSLPDPPRRVEVLEVNRTEVRLGWQRGRPGLSPLLGYTVQMWSPDTGGSWQVADTSQTPTTSHSPTPVSLRVMDLKPHTRYVFVVRARNSHGLSQPSPFTHTLRTLARGTQGQPLHEIRARLSQAAVRLVGVEANSPTSLLVTWHLVVDVALVEGIHVRYRPLTSRYGGPAGGLSVEKVDLHGPESPPTSHIVTKLRAATWYEVFVVPYFRIVEGQASSAIRASTHEAPPQLPPQGLHFTKTNTSNIRLTWDPISSQVGSGHITGYLLQVHKANGSLIMKKTVNATWTSLSGLTPGHTYLITVRSITTQGYGPPSHPLTISIPNIMVDFLPKDVRESHPFHSNTYIIVAICIGAGMVFAALTLTMCCIYQRTHITKTNHYYSKGNNSDGGWQEYRDWWGDGVPMGITGMSMYSDITNHGTTTHSAYKGYEPRLADNVYEDPEGLRLVSLGGHGHNSSALYRSQGSLIGSCTPRTIKRPPYSLARPDYEISTPLTEDNGVLTNGRVVVSDNIGAINLYSQHLIIAPNSSQSSTIGANSITLGCKQSPTLLWISPNHDNNQRTSESAWIVGDVYNHNSLHHNKPTVESASEDEECEDEYSSDDSCYPYRPLTHDTHNLDWAMGKEVEARWVGTESMCSTNDDKYSTHPRPSHPINMHKPHPHHNHPPTPTTHTSPLI